MGRRCEVGQKPSVSEQSLATIRRVRRRTCRVERARREGKARACLWISKELRLWSWTRNAAQLYFRTPEGQLSCCARVDDLSIISCPDRLFSILQFSLFSLDFLDSFILLFYFLPHSFPSLPINSPSQCLKPSKSSPTSPRTSSVREPSSSADAPSVRHTTVALIFSGSKLTQWYTADKREFIKISQAVGMGFLIMVRNSRPPIYP